MNELIYVQLARLENGQVWMFRQEGNQWVPHRHIKQIIDIQPISVEISEPVEVS